MALVFADRVRETTSTAGTGTFSLLGAVSSCQSFAAIGNGNTTYYTAVNQVGTEWEVGLGTYNAGTITRDTILASSNGGAIVNFSAGTKDIFCDYPAGKAVLVDGSGNTFAPNIGGTTASAGTFTTLTATGQTSLGGAAGSEGLRVSNIASAVNYIWGYGASTGNTPTLSVAGSDTNINWNFVTKGSGAFNFFSNSASPVRQLSIAHTSSAVNYVQVIGAATGITPIIGVDGSDSQISLLLRGKGSAGGVTLGTSFGNYFRAVGGAGITTVNNLQAQGSATTFAPVLSAQGSDTNIPIAFQSKGTGAIDLAAGSSGVNISNGGTVTAITRTANGTGYTSIPSVAITAPTTAGGVQATATATMFAITATVQAGGTGYAVGNVLTVVGGTYSSQATFTVSAVSAGVVTAVTLTSGGTAYSVLPTNPVSTTGGTGTGATLNITSWGVSTIPVGTAGSGYVEQPTVTFSGGGGSGAAAFARVGGAVTLTSLGSTLNLNTEAGTGFRVLSAGTTATDMWQAISNGTTAILRSSNSTSNAQVQTSGTGGVQLGTSSGVTQCLVSHTASAVNYVQVTGAATGSAPTISAQGSDTNTGLTFINKGTSAFEFRNDATSGVFGIELAPNTTVDKTTFIDFHSSASTDFDFRLSRNPSVNGNAVYQNQGTGSHVFYTASNANQLTVTHTASAVNYVQVTGAATGASPTITLQGSDANVSGVISTKGTGGLSFYTNNVNQRQFRIIHTASSVNFFDVTGAAAGASPVISCSGTDTNIDLNLTTKGVGSHRLNSGTGLAFIVNSQTSNANYGAFTSTSTGTSPLLQVAGSDTNIDFRLRTQGTGGYQLDTGTNGNTQLKVVNIASAVNFVQIVGAASLAGAPSVSFTGSDASVGGFIVTKGGGGFSVVSQGGANRQFRVDGGTAAVNYLQVQGSIAGSAPILSAQGSDTDVDLILGPKGAGRVQYGTYTGTVLAITGYIEIKDSGGTVRRLAVVA